MHLFINLNKLPTSPLDSTKIFNVLKLFYCKLIWKTANYHSFSSPKPLLYLNTPSLVCLTANLAAQTGSTGCSNCIPEGATATAAPPSPPTWGLLGQRVPSSSCSRERRANNQPLRYKIALSSLQGAGNPALAWSPNFTTVMKNGQ